VFRLYYLKYYKTLSINIPVTCLFLFLLAFFACGEEHLPLVRNRYEHWRTYAGTYDAARFSTLKDIDKNNVTQLKVAWEYHTGDLDTNNRGQMQCNPIVIDTVLYGLTAKNKLFAVHAGMGRELWQFDAFKAYGGSNSWAGTGRGVSYWSEGDEQRLLFCAGNSLIAVDARTGQPMSDFGERGRVDLQRDLDYHRDSFLIVNNTPGVVYKDMIILGMRLSEALDAAPGHIRAYDVRTGKRRWIFHTIPHPGEYGFDTWQDSSAWRRIGGANCWAGMSLDVKRGIVFAGTGSSTYDFWGGNRKGANLFANCVLALDANTGRRIWHYQTIHHDIWDRDHPANPNLVTVMHKGKPVDAVAQITKHGFVFLLDRETGKPLFPIREVSVPSSTLGGEEAWPTQPKPELPVPYMRQNFTEADINNVLPEFRAEILPRFRALQSGNMFLPPSEQGIVLFPGFDGGGEWGGAAFDPGTGVLYVNSNEMPWIVQMRKNDQTASTGQRLYSAQCANCHGADRKGNNGAFPALTGIAGKYNMAQIGTIIQNGRGAMPGFRNLSGSERGAIAAFLSDKETVGEAKEPVSDRITTPYSMNGYQRFVTKDGYPAIAPPWGTLNAIDLNTGAKLWSVPLGEFKALSAKGVPKTGTENYGGPVVTAGGVLFIGASKDEHFRAFDKDTGRELWSYKLPAGGYATPATYRVGGRQYVVIACGGGKMGTKSGDSYVAFAL
jgi:quinoprotein glucose dehydrogenase